MFGGTPTRLARAFVTRYFRGEAHGARFLGHEFLRPYLLRQTRPQICPTCLRLDAKALAAWSISLVTACPIHRLALLDHCVCGRVVSWRRPSIDTCECGRLLTEAYQPVRQGDPREISISAQVTYLLDTDQFHPPFDENLGQFNSVSVDFFLRLVWIFGIIDRDSNGSRAHSANRLLPTSEASLLCGRAYDRLTRLMDLSRHSGVVTIHHTALDALLDECRSVAESQFINSLQSRLNSAFSSNAVDRHRKLVKQLPLFGD